MIGTECDGPLFRNYLLQRARLAATAKPARAKPRGLAHRKLMGEVAAENGAPPRAKGKAAGGRSRRLAPPPSPKPERAHSAGTRAPRPVPLPPYQPRVTPPPYLNPHERNAEIDSVRSWLRAARQVARSRRLTAVEAGLVRRVNERFMQLTGLCPTISLG